jgi:hypothetical protein
LERFDVVFALGADPVLLIFGFTVFFELLRAAIVKLSTRERTLKLVRKLRPPEQGADCLSTNRATSPKDAQGLRLHD